MTIEFTNRVAGLGADAVLIKPPHYYKSLMSPAVIKSFYFEVADKSTVPVLIYNIPQNTGISVEPLHRHRALPPSEHRGHQRQFGSAVQPD